MWILITFIALVVFVYWYTYPKPGEFLLAAYQQRAMQHAGLVRRRYSINGISMSVLETAGSRDKAKPMLMMVHGFTGDNTLWLPLAALFKNDYHIVIPDLPGHGHTGFSPEWHYDIAAQSRLLTALIWRIGYHRATLIGNSMGGYIATWMARHHSRSVHQVVLLSPAGLTGKNKSRLDCMLDQGTNPFFVTRRRAYYRLLAMSMAAGPYIPKMVKDVLADRHIARVSDYQRVFDDMVSSGYFSSQDLAQVSCRCLVIWGAKDELLDVSCLKSWTAALHCDQEIFHDVGHMPMLEAPGRTYQRIVHFLNHKHLEQAA